MPDKRWDEYDWERFLQEQERRTEKYLELIEKYMNHPDRDEIIAREMGWTHLSGEQSKEWEDEVDSEFDEAVLNEEQEEPGKEAFQFEKHPLYLEAIAFCAELDHAFANVGHELRDNPALTSLRDGATMTAAKLAAALNDDDAGELGMTIAYLKRALSALTSTLDAAVALHEQGLADSGMLESLRSRIFSIRDGIVTAMGKCRSEFRRRNEGA